MRIRSYEFFEIRRGWDEPDLIRRCSSERDAREYFEMLHDSRDKEGTNVYLVRVTLIAAAKADKK